MSNSTGKVARSELTLVLPDQQFITSSSTELYLLRRKILNGIIDEAANLIDIQSTTNRQFNARTDPRAAINLQEAQLCQMKKKSD
jgi:hypothetical protein